MPAYYASVATDVVCVMRVVQLLILLLRVLIGLHSSACTHWPALIGLHRLADPNGLLPLTQGGNYWMLL